jgi:hypothetical protein
MSTAPYQHWLNAERNEIRTLTLIRGGFHDPIQCSLQTVSLDDHPTYNALSYVWGNVENNVPIAVDGTVFLATENLKLALQYIREVHRDIVLWVDAICINQNDTDERNYKVSLMGTLYSEAKEVIIWLGEADETTDGLVRVVQETGLPALPATDAEDYEESWLRYRNTFTRTIFSLAIVGLRPWWNRVWTVQECILARSDPIFRCGPHIFLWERFFDILIKTLDNIHRIAPSLDEIFENNPSIREILLMKLRLNKDAGGQEDHQTWIGMIAMQSYRRKRKEADDGLSPAAAIMATLGRQASVPHDYIYGILGLVTNEAKDNIGLGYRSSLWPVYRNFFKKMLTDTPGSDELKLLTMISFHKETDDLPSWLPDFSQQENIFKHTGMALWSETRFRTLEKVRWGDGNQILNLEDVCLDVVDQVFDMEIDEHNYIDHMMVLARDVQNETTARSEALPSRSPLREPVEVSMTTHISQLFIGSFLIDNDKEVSDTLAKTYWDSVTEYYNSDVVLGKTPEERLENIPFESLARVFPQALQVCKGRRVVISRAGISGLSVPDVRPGDQIVCLYGLNMPFILRPKHCHYKLIGGVRLPGLTDWAVLTECQKDGRLHEATFRIG